MNGKRLVQIHWFLTMVKLFYPTSLPNKSNLEHHYMHFKRDINTC